VVSSRTEGAVEHEQVRAEERARIGEGPADATAKIAIAAVISGVR
jgi:hypothetical protein